MFVIAPIVPIKMVLCHTTCRSFVRNLIFPWCTRTQCPLLPPPQFFKGRLLSLLGYSSTTSMTYILTRHPSTTQRNPPSEEKIKYGCYVNHGNVNLLRDCVFTI